MKTIPNIIVLLNGDIVEAWGSLTEICTHHPEFSYHYLKRQKYPFSYKGWRFEKVKFRQRHPLAIPAV